MKTLYEILEVSENASKEVIEKAYRVLAKKYHPDLQPEEQKQKAETTIKKINEAYDILSNEVKRKEYDEMLKQKRLQEENEKIQQELEKRKQNTANSYVWYRGENLKNNHFQENVQQNGNLDKQNIKNQKKMEEQLQKNMQNAYEAKYQKAYENYLKSLGYKIKYKWTWKNYRDFLITILIIALICVALWFFPPTHNWMIEFYESNSVIKALVDVIGKVFVGIWNAICSVFQ